MVSLLILGVVVAWVALWLYVFKHAPNRAVRVSAVLAAVLIPFWDLPIGYFQYQRHCSGEGGLRVHEPIPSQDAVYFESLPSEHPAAMLKQGFKVVEIRRSDGRGIVRHELQQSKVISRTVENPESHIAISIIRNQRLAWNIYRDQYVAHRLGETKPIASYTTFSWHGGWFQESGWSLLSGTLDCFLERTDPLINLLQRGS